MRGTASELGLIIIICRLQIALSKVPMIWTLFHLQSLAPIIRHRKRVWNFTHCAKFSSDRVSVMREEARRMMGSVLRCVGWISLALLALILADVCSAQPGKSLGFTEKFDSEISWERCVLNGVGSEEFSLPPQTTPLTLATDETAGYKGADNIGVKVLFDYSCSHKTGVWAVLFQARHWFSDLTVEIYQGHPTTRF